MSQCSSGTRHHPPSSATRVPASTHRCQVGASARMGDLPISQPKFQDGCPWRFGALSSRPRCSGLRDATRPVPHAAHHPGRDGGTADCWTRWRSASCRRTHAPQAPNRGKAFRPSRRCCVGPVDALLVHQGRPNCSFRNGPIPAQPWLGKAGRIRAGPARRGLLAEGPWPRDGQGRSDVPPSTNRRSGVESAGAGHAPRPLAMTVR